MHALIEFLLQHQVVERIEVRLHVSSPDNEFISVRGILVNGSILFIRESIKGAQRRYSYHWQNQKGRLIVRWDNSPHHTRIATYPHHKHVGTKARIYPSFETTLPAALRYIQEQIQS